ncbi:hypothetical protein GOODEAATRI_032611, partial [Goodea atripinnis]
NLASELETQVKAREQLDSARYLEQINNCLSEFDKRFQDFLCSSQSLHSCAILLRKMLRLIHAYQTLQHCFT